MKDRVMKIIEKTNQNISDFADSIGINPQTLNAALKRNQTINTPIIQAILAKYDNINPDWLMMGRGPMYRGEKSFLEPDLFPETSLFEDNLKEQKEYRKEMEDNRGQNALKAAQNHKLTGEFISTKKIDKIIIFYSDNTFDTLTPEESK